MAYLRLVNCDTRAIAVLKRIRFWIPIYLNAFTVNKRTRKFFSYYRPYLKLLSVNLACAMLASAIAVTLPLCARHITKHLLARSAPDTIGQIYSVGLLMAGLIIVFTLCEMIVSHRGHMMGTYMERDMRSELFDHYQKQSFGFFDNRKVGQLMTRLSHDTYSLGELYHHGPEDVVITFIKFFGTFVILMTINVPLTLIVFAFLPFMAIYAFYFNRKMNTALRETRNRVGDINARVEDTLAGIRVVQSFTNETIEKEKFAEANEGFVESRRKGYRSETYFYHGIVTFTELFAAAVVVFGGASIVAGSLDLADLITYLLYLGLLVEPIRTSLNFARLYQEGITGFDRFMEMLEIQPDIEDSPEAIDLVEIEGRVEFRDVTFKYQANHHFVFRKLSLAVQPGEFVALVGPSGVGKTTLCSLIPRFYDLSEGAIFIDDYNVKDVSLSSLREQIGIVQQDVYLFAGTIAENISYGKQGATEDEIMEAARKANAHDFILSLPNGYGTDIGQRGVKLSGGQKQRLSIARVFLKDPPIIIFDEATSALDNESERAVQDSLEKLTNNRTMIVIAHRLSTVRNAQRIVVMSAEGIVEEGTHDELIQMGGNYARLQRTRLSI